MPVAIRNDVDTTLGTGRQEILRVLKGYPGLALSPKEIHAHLPHMTTYNLKITIRRMHLEGQIAKAARGAYYVKSK